MDIKEWVGPTALGSLIAALLALVGVKGWQGHKRTQSNDDLADTQNTVAGIYLNNLLEDNARLKRERDEAMDQAHVNHQLFVAEQRRADVQGLELRAFEIVANAKIERLEDQVKKLSETMVKYRPDERAALSQSGFVPLQGEDQ